MATMDQDLARQLFFEGATLVLLDVPVMTEFGIDYNSWNVGEKFKGVKMIPEGFHFVQYSSVSKEGETGPRTGFFHFFRKKELLVRRWDEKTEDLTDAGISSEMVERIRSGLKDLDGYLGAYPYDSLRKWVALTSRIQENVVNRVQPHSKKVSSVTCISKLEDQPPPPMESSSSSPSTVDMSPGGHFAGVGDFPPAKIRKPQPLQLSSLPVDIHSVLNFTDTSRVKLPKEASPSEVTKHCMDGSYTLEHLIQTVYNSNPMDVLGELQLAFVAFLIGHVYDAFEWWKNMVMLLCSCDNSLSTHTQLFINFITMLHFQLQETPEDFFLDIVTKNNFLTVSLQRFFSNLEQSETAQKSLVKRGLQFRDFLIKRFKWDFSEEPEEDAPTVVHGIEANDST